MRIPPSKHFTALDLTSAFNLNRYDFPVELEPQAAMRSTFGTASFRGIPFELGDEDKSNAIFLNKEPVSIATDGVKATYLVILHTGALIRPPHVEGFGETVQAGNLLGEHVSDYVLEYEDGETETCAVYKRFAIQHASPNWGASGFACIPANKESTFRSTEEETQLNKVPGMVYGRGETRTAGGRGGGAGGAWLYAFPNPNPDKPIKQITLQPQNERSAVYGITVTELTEHPLRWQPRRKLLLTLPEGVPFNAIDEIDGIDIDLGNIISARRRLVYDDNRWNTNEVDLQPTKSDNQVVVEYSAHPDATMYIKTKGEELISYGVSTKSEPISILPPAHQPVTIKVIDKKTRHPVGVRLHLHGKTGEYLPPKGYHRKVNAGWFEDNYGEFVNQANQYAYIRGECVADLPRGNVYVEITRGYEVTPIRETVKITQETTELTFELGRVLDWRSLGWVTADTHVHFLTPTTAVLEGEAEDINVVNLLASQWGEMFSNVSDFDGTTTHSNTLPGNDGEFLCRVGTENRMQILGHISLLGYSGEMIHPLCSGGPDESASGDFQEVTMADWAQRCLDQNGLVVMPHAPNPQCERVADVVLDLVNAIEFMSFNPFNSQLLPTAVADWYRFLNVGYHLPLTGGSDKMSASSMLGGLRTYTQMGDREFTYENWMEATRAGHTFATVGPLVDMQVEGQPPGSKIKLPEGGGTVNVTWKVESVRLPVNAVEVIEGGHAVSEDRFEGTAEADGSVELNVTESTWIAVRVRGSYQNDAERNIAAHTSAVQVLVGDKPVYRQEDAMEMLRQIEGAIAYIDTIASRPDADRYKKLKLTLDTAYNRMHQRMHQQGVFHEHSPLHDHGHEH